jgi:cysteine desulfurase
MPKHALPVYLDCNATSPLEPAVQKLVQRFLNEEYGNAGSRTHEYGNRAKLAVQQARDQLANALRAERDEVLFTSGATESNNLALLGLAPFGEQTDRRHIITGAVEHKAVLEPVEALQRRGYTVTVLPPTSGGYIDPDDVRRALRPDTLVVSLMHVNNETGVEQPLAEYVAVLGDHHAYLHVDAAQGFGKKNEPLRNDRIDLISISGHKIYAPKGIGALVTRRRGNERPPLSPILFGGGQEWGLRPGTLPVPLIAGLGLAAQLADKHAAARAQTCRDFRACALTALAPLGVEFNGDQDRVLPHTLNIAVPGLDAEAFMLATKHLISISNGSACTSHSYQPSHVLKAMGLRSERIQSSLRLSWSHLTPAVDWSAVVNAVERVR